MSYYINAARNLFQGFLQYIYTQHALSNVLQLLEKYWGNLSYCLYKAMKN